MKTAIKTTSTAIRRLFLWLAIFAIDVQIEGIKKTMPYIRCPLTLGRMEIAKHVARTERTRLRSEYNATLPPGKRITWSMA